MDIFFKAAAMAVICVILYLILSKNNKDFAVLLSLTACCFLGTVALRYLESVIDFILDLSDKANIDSGILKILLKSTGISILSEFCALICNDAGNSAMAKGIQLLSAATILWLSLPIFANLLELTSNLLTNI